VGTLPSGAIVTSKGQQRGTWVLVGVELESGDLVEGWLDRSSVDGDVKELESLNNVDEKKKMSIRTGRVVIPEDEGLLLRREHTFLYGLHLGGNYGIMQSEQFDYTGISATGGGYVGIFLTPTIPLRFEVSLTQFKGTSPDDPTQLGFNFLDVAVVPAYQIQRFELFAGLQYSFGLGLNEVPSGITLNSARDVSSVGFQAGAGYRAPIGGADFVVRARYTGLFISNPFTFQGISLLLGLEFRG